MNTETLKLFVLTFQKGNFATVAKQLNVSPSSVSRAIANLEIQLSTRLFQRNTRSLQPTIAGISYYEGVRPLLEELEGLHQGIMLGNDIPSGLIRISASTTYGERVLPLVLKTFCEHNPHVSFDLNLTDARVDLIEEQIDVAIRHGSLPDSTLIARKLKDVEYFLVASPDYIKSMGAINSPEDLSHHHIITFSYSAFTKQWHFSSASYDTSITVKPFMKVSNAAMIRECVLRGMGVSLLADWTINEDISNGSLVRLLPEFSVSGDNRTSSIWVVQPSRAYIPTKVTAFTDFLFNCLQ